MWLATSEAEMFRARWTEDIHRGWMASLTADRPDVDAEGIRRRMDSVVDDCLITGYEEVVESLDLPDPDDRHVLAAAIVGRVGVIVTVNLKIFRRRNFSPSAFRPGHRMTSSTTSSA